MPDRTKALAQVVGRRIRQLRRERGWMQVDLASQMDDAVGQAALSQYETGKTLPSMAVLIRLAEAFSVPVPALLLDPAQGTRAEVAIAALTRPKALVSRLAGVLAEYDQS